MSSVQPAEEGETEYYDADLEMDPHCVVDVCSQSPDGQVRNPRVFIQEQAHQHPDIECRVFNQTEIALYGLTVPTAVTLMNVDEHPHLLFQETGGDWLARSKNSA